MLNDLFGDCCGLIIESSNILKTARSHLEEKGLFLALQKKNVLVNVKSYVFNDLDKLVKMG